MQCKYTTKSDVWSFGICLWEILQLASVRPYSALTDDKVLHGLEAVYSNEESEGSLVVLERPPLCPKVCT